MFLASLKLEYNLDNYLPVGIVSQTIYFVYSGKLEVTLEDES